MQQQNIYVFDLDGVITNPEDSSVDNTCVEQLYALLEQNTCVAVNTGRSFAWVNENLLQALSNMGGHEHFDHLFIVCEKGGESLIWQDGAFRELPSRFALGVAGVAKCKQVFDEAADSLDTMFWDSTKQTMATIEKKPDADLATFHEQQITLVDKLKQAFQGQDVRIDGTTIATDVELPSAGKHAGAELIYEWLLRRAATEQASFICFGDSKSDYEMARYFSDQGNATTFVFVGKQDVVFEEHTGVLLHRTQSNYSLGTREYFLAQTAH